MRVLLLVHLYPPFGVTGVERVAESTAQGLAERGEEVTVLARRPVSVPPTLRLETERRGRVTVKTLAGGGIELADYPRGDADLVRAFRRVLAETAPDVLLVSHLMYHSPLCVALAHRFGVPVVMELHDFHSVCPLAHLQRVSGELCGGPEGGRACATFCFPQQPATHERWALRFVAFRDALQKADRLLCPSRYVAEYFRPLVSSGAEIHVVPNGIFFDRRPAPAASTERDPGTLELVTVGAVQAHKGIDTVIEAIRTTHLEVRYRLLGPVHGPTAAGLTAAADRVPGLRLRLHGPFDPPDLPSLLRGADALIIPSVVGETFSLVAREALACGVPVLATRVGALPDPIVDGRNGFVFEPGDAAGLAGLLQRLAWDDRLLATLRAGALATPIRMARERVEDVRSILASAVAEGRPREPATSSGAEVVALRDELLSRI